MANDSTGRVKRLSPARVFPLGQEPSGDLVLSASPEERLEMVAELSRRAWELSGNPWPSLPRSEWPVRVVKLRD